MSQREKTTVQENTDLDYQNAVVAAYTTAFQGGTGRLIFIDLGAFINGLSPEDKRGAACMYAYLLQKSTVQERRRMGKGVTAKPAKGVKTSA